MSKRLLVTGGAGFIGSNFVKYIYRNYPDYRITVLDTLTYAGNLDNLTLPGYSPSGNGNGNGRYSFWYGNIRNAELVDTLMAQTDIVVHFAAESHVTRSIYDNLIFFETDVLGTQVIANSVLKHADTVERFIHISTSEVYGTARAPVIDEEHPLLPASPYASAKCGADRLVYSYWHTYNLPLVIVRPFNNYGPYQHLEKVIPRFITSCILGEPLTVHGDGSSSRDWLYVDDHCQALDRVMHAPLDGLKGEVINIGSGISTDIMTLAQLISRRMGVSPDAIAPIDDRPGQVFRHTSSTEKAERLLGWRASTSLEVGIDKTIAWYQENRKWWEKQMWLRKIPIITASGRREYH